MGVAAVADASGEKRAIIKFNNNNNNLLYLRLEVQILPDGVCNRH